MNSLKNGLNPKKAIFRKTARSLVKFVLHMRFHPRQRAFQEGQRIFFVTGRCRSGTTWMANLLNSHQGLFCDQNENQAFHQSFEFKHFSDTPILLTDSIKEYYTQRTLKLLKNGLITNLICKCDKPFVRKLGDKSPQQDVSLLLDMFPAATVIIMMRDFRDVCVSTAFHWSRGSGTWKGDFTNSEKKALDNDFLKKLLEGYEKKRDFKSYSGLAYKKPKQVKIVRFEDMKAKPENTLKDVFSFLGTNDSSSIVKRCVRLNTFEKLSSGRKPGQEDSENFFRKGTIGDWRNYFSAENIAVFKEVAGDTLVAAGYERNNNWG